MPDKMTKPQLIRELARKTGTTQKKAASFLKSLADTALKETKRRGSFSIPGLGELRRSVRKARTGRNPISGDVIHIAGRTAVRFRLASSAKESLGLLTSTGPVQRKSRKKNRGGYGGPLIQR